jgi:hypothetical protein
LRNLPLHPADEHAKNCVLYQRNHAWCANSIPQHKKNATTLLTFFLENVAGCVFRTTLKSILKRRTALQHEGVHGTRTRILQ